MPSSSSQIATRARIAENLLVMVPATPTVFVRVLLVMRNLAVAATMAVCGCSMVFFEVNVIFARVTRIRVRVRV